MPQVETSPVATPSAPRGWRRARRQRPIPKHDWQVELPPRRFSTLRWRPFRLAGALALLTALIGCFLFVALDAPERTPLLIVTDVRPGAIPQSSWLAEEIERLKLLDRTTLTVVEQPPVSSVGTAVAGFRQSLQELSRSAARTGAVIVYLRLPGLVDDVGRPCLVPSQASLVRSEEWLPVEPLLDELAGDVFPKNVQRLVIFDRCQSSSVWQAGILADSFPDQLAALTKRQHQAGRWKALHVLSDTSGRQKSWDSPALGGSVFGEAVWSALSGRANSAEAGGNGDRHVSLSEMAAYVTRRTTAWVWENRKQVQTPCLLSSDSEDFHLFWAAPEEEQEKWRTAADRLRTPVDQDAALQRMKRMWSARSTLDEQAPWRADPAGWQQLNHQLLKYERLLSGGAAAARQREVVERDVQALLESVGNAVKSRSPFDHGQARLHHRHLAQRQNPDRRVEFEHASDVFDQIRRRPSREGARTLLAELQKRGDALQDWDFVVLQHLVDDAPDSSWAHPELTSRVLGLIETLGELQASSEVTVSLMLERQYQPVEATLREILDDLFVGTDDRLANALTLVTAAEKRLADCKRGTADLLKAVDRRDRAAADLPRLAEWIYAPGCGAGGPAAQRGIEDWVAAANCWKQLESALDQCDERGATVESASLAASLATQLERELAALWRRVEQTYDRLLTGDSDAAAVTEMQHLLSTALLPRQPDSMSRTPVEQRMSLHEMWQQASTQLAIRFAAKPSDASPPEANGSTAPDAWMIQIARGAAPHPMFAMLALTVDKSKSQATRSGPLRLELLSQSWMRSVLVRHALAEIPQGLQRGTNASFDSTIARERTWRAQAQQVRAAAYWLPGDVPYKPSHRLQLAACGRLLRSRAACVVEDFWAGQSDDVAPFFIRAADDLLDGADLCDANWPASLSAAGKADANQIRRRLVAYRSQTEPALHVTAIAVPQILATDDLQSQVDVRRSPHGLIPAGVTAVFLSHGDRLAETTVARVAADVPGPNPATPDAATSRVGVRSHLPTGVLDKTRSCRAFAYFRGHRFGDDFQLAPTAGLAARSAPGANVRTTVTVRSDRRRPTAILFVLDASASMTDEVPREGTRGTIRKIDAAVEALTSLLNDLADERDVQVGVTFYGHRVAAGESAAAGVVRQPAYQQRFPFALTLQPFEDVETVLPVGRFGPEQLGRMEERLGSLKPWGETPLYLSIVEGLERLETAPKDATRTMVVITDGLNYQFDPTPEKRTGLDDVLRAVPGREVAVHLLGFGIDDGEVEQAREEFARISEATGGSSDVTVRDAARLQTHLRSLYQPGRFSIGNGAGFQKSAQVGTPVALPPSKGGDGSFEVRYESAAAEISIVGGEKLTFRPAEDGTLRIVSELPYVSTSLRERDSGQDSPCELVAARPARNGDELILRWSLRRRDGQFTPRPTAGYFRVQPLDARGTEIGVAAVCVGPASVSGQPLPTWEFRIPSWPREAVTARLQGWVSSQPVPVDRSESCASLLERQQKDESWQALPLPAVGWQIRQDGTSVTLVERYDAVGEEPQVWTELTRDPAPPSPKAVKPPTPLHVERRYDAEHRLFVQTWNFDRELGAEDLAALRFQFTSLERLRSQSWVTSDSLSLSTNPQALVIRPVPTTTR